MAAEAKRIGESKIIQAKAEVESAKLMRKAADILASKPAMQIRYLDAMQNMARTGNTKVIFMPSQSAIEKTAMSASGETGNGEGNGIVADSSYNPDDADVARIYSIQEATSSSKN
ncbi:unnamed protein product [Ambrosiozyma monospora]|uniref:Unnamed protein product n=1 Tax=Ambrosiozyma monospora TaxID=43982 RepID=A0ACB5SVK8_AMBMO|nr:unnamed protein product [Ambrosiozyma monospora]